MSEWDKQVSGHPPPRQPVAVLIELEPLARPEFVHLHYHFRRSTVEEGLFLADAQIVANCGVVVHFDRQGGVTLIEKHPKFSNVLEVLTPQGVETPTLLFTAHVATSFAILARGRRG